MSYQKVKSIKISNNQVLVTGKCNNDTEPVRQWHCTYFDEYFELGVEQVKIEILKAYESGNFQSTSSINNEFTRALDALYAMPEYKKFNWRNKTYTDDCKIEEARNSNAFENILKEALKNKS